MSSYPAESVGIAETSTVRFASQRSRFACIASQISGPSPLYPASNGVVPTALPSAVRIFSTRSSA